MRIERGSTVGDVLGKGEHRGLLYIVKRGPVAMEVYIGIHKLSRHATPSTVGRELVPAKHGRHARYATYSSESDPLNFGMGADYWWIGWDYGNPAMDVPIYPKSYGSPTKPFPLVLLAKADARTAINGLLGLD